MNKIEENNLIEEEHCYYSGLPSVQFYENIERESETNLKLSINLVKSDIYDKDKQNKHSRTFIRISI